jgi:hypothetical protein
MGFLDDLLFPGSGNKKIGRTRFKKVREELYSKGMSVLHRDKIEAMFLGDLDEDGAQKGISKKEFEDRIKWMRENKSKHGLSDNEINMVEEIMSGMY